MTEAAPIRIGLVPADVSSAFDFDCGSRTNSPSSHSTISSDAFLNVDIVDGDIVAINTKRQSPVSYTDFPDIFNTGTSTTSATSSSTTSKYVSAGRAENANDQSVPSTVGRNTASGVFASRNSDSIHLENDAGCQNNVVAPTRSTLREQVRMSKSKRTDFPLMRSRTALLIIDVQTFCCSRALTMSEYFHNESLPRMIENIQQHLLPSFRAHRDDVSRGTPEHSEGGCEVIFTVIQSRTKDRRDISLDYKLSGPTFENLPTVETPFEEIYLPEVRPDQGNGKGDIVIPKTSCSVFQSTNLDFTLRNLNIEQLVVCGQLTEQCVESAVRDAADLGYLVTVAEDACATLSSSRHQRGLEGMNGFCRICSTQQIVSELKNDLDCFTNRSLAGDVTAMLAQTDGNFVPSQTVSCTGISQNAVQRTVGAQMNTFGMGSAVSGVSAALLRSLQHGNISFVRYMWVDLGNNLQCYNVPIDRLQQQLQQTGTLEYPVTVGYDDDTLEDDVFVMRPDLSTLQILPSPPQTAFMMGCLEADGPPLCTRKLLDMICHGRAQSHGVGFVVQAEVPFTLHIPETGKPVDNYSTFSTANKKRLKDQSDLIDDLYRKLKAQHIEVDTIKAGSAPAQIIVVLSHKDPLQLADSVVLTQETIHSVSVAHSLCALFLRSVAIPSFGAEKESSMSSLNALRLTIILESDMVQDFSVESSSDSKQRISDKDGAFIQGILRHLSGLIVLALPTVNSYRLLDTTIRMDSSWSFDKTRKTPVRVIQPLQSHRNVELECTFCDNACNIYLVLASLLAAGLDGINKNLKLQKQVDEEDSDFVSPPLPQSLEAAIQKLEEDCDSFNFMGNTSILEKYLALRKHELQKASAQTWEDEMKQALENAS